MDGGKDGPFEYNCGHCFMEPGRRTNYSDPKLSIKTEFRNSKCTDLPCFPMLLRHPPTSSNIHARVAHFDTDPPGFYPRELWI